MPKRCVTRGSIPGRGLAPSPCFLKILIPKGGTNQRHPAGSLPVKTLVGFTPPKKPERPEAPFPLGSPPRWFGSRGGNTCHVISPLAACSIL